MIGWTLFLVLFVCLSIWLVAGLGRTVETFRGHSRCRSCGASLGVIGLRFDPKCLACGAVQPWAQTRRA